MPGETSLAKLLATLKATLQPNIFVFATIPPADVGSIPAEVLHEASMTFREAEGLTLVLPEELAIRHNIDHTYRSRQITLDIHSSLDAVGFMAVISTRLAKEGFSSNPVSAYFHDHLFVKVEEAEAVVSALEAIQAEAERETVGSV